MRWELVLLEWYSIPFMHNFSVGLYYVSIRWERVLLESYSVPFLHKLSIQMYNLWMCYPYIHEMRTCSLIMISVSLAHKFSVGLYHVSIRGERVLLDSFSVPLLHTYLYIYRICICIIHKSIKWDLVLIKWYPLLFLPKFSVDLNNLSIRWELVLLRWYAVPFLHKSSN